MDLDVLAALRTPIGVEALAAAESVADRDALAAAASLRARGIEPRLAAAALTQVELRRRAAVKFGEDAASMFFTRAGLEQATRREVARRRAERLRDAGVTHLADLGCGIGADMIAAARAGIIVTAVDADPLTAAIAAANVETLGLAGYATVTNRRAEDVDLSGIARSGIARSGIAWSEIAAGSGVGAGSGIAAVFCDPARRKGTSRIFDPAAFSPPWTFVTALARSVPHVVLKLAPGIDHALIPSGAEAEWVSVDGDAVEAAFWCGPLARVPRRASLLRSELLRSDGRGEFVGHDAVEFVGEGRGALTGDGLAGRAGDGWVELTGDGLVEAPVGAVRRYVYDPDPAVVRAHLVSTFASLVDGVLADPTIAYVYSDTAVATQFGRGYEIIDTMPFSLKRLRATLRERGIGRLTIKKRGSALEPEQLRKDLRLSGRNELTIILARVAGAPIVLLCQPLVRQSTS